MTADQMIEAEVFEQIKHRVFSEEQHNPDRNAYHNSDHFRAVLENVDYITQASDLSSEQICLLRLAAVFHDYGHCGFARREDAPQTTHRRDLTNEEYAALKAKESLVDYLSPPQLEILESIIISTSYGYDDSPKPETKLEKIFALADVAKFRLGFGAWFEDNVNLHREFYSDKLPLNFELWQEQALDFMSLIKSRLEAVSGYLSVTIVHELELAHKNLEKQINNFSRKEDVYNLIDVPQDFWL